MTYDVKELEKRIEVQEKIIKELENTNEALKLINHNLKQKNERQSEMIKDYDKALNKLMKEDNNG